MDNDHFKNIQRQKNKKGSGTHTKPTERTNMATLPTLGEIHTLATRPENEIITSLNNFARDMLNSKESYEYVLSQLFHKENTWSGEKIYSYEELVSGDSTSPYDDVTITDFNGGLNKVAAEIMTAKKEVNLKTKILDKTLMTFLTSPSEASWIALFSETSNIIKKRDMTLESDYLSMIDNSVIEVNTDGIDDVNSKGDSVNKMIYSKLISLQTTSKKHEGVGTNGVITTKDGATVNPAKVFSPSDFVLIKSPSFEVNTTFDGERTFFNWNAKQIQLNRVITLDLGIYEAAEGITFSTILPDAFKAILIHKDLLQTIEIWNGTKVVNTPKLYQIVHNYVKYGIYRLLDKPAFVFQPATPAAGN